MRRITRDNLETLCKTINKITGHDHDSWDEGTYQLDGANGGWALDQIAGRGARNILHRDTKRGLYDRMHAYLDGLLVNDKAHDLLVELVEVVKSIPSDKHGGCGFWTDHDELGDRINSYLGKDK